MPHLLGYSKLISIKTPHGVLSKQFRYPGVKGKQRISQWAKSNIRMEGVQGSAKKQRWRFILISAPLPDR
ncbi:hypothetical protein ELP80_02890 [Shigella sonnei]|nr:hypothetical protein [Escherichia coli]EFQ0019859.1 hypothetical protein [Shigella flexneri]RUL08325.1 hypothetical protein ELP80_02890 [Shigella sonnei]EEY8304595.1 hypothetical protein [Escherichia coli]EFC4059450.1 hypothetical protein [Escherichia coli]